jgi:hypothetical protein
LVLLTIFLISKYLYFLIMTVLPLSCIPEDIAARHSTPPLSMDGDAPPADDPARLIIHKKERVPLLLSVLC